MNNQTLEWNATLGLVRQNGPGHTRTVAHHPCVHNGVATAHHLCSLAQRGRLQAGTLEISLATFRRMQNGKDEALEGCLRWYWEESEIADTNAAFFIILSLQLLWLAEGHRFTATCRESLHQLLHHADIWFAHELRHAHPRYPNKAMGDLVCAWLNAEILGHKPSPLLLQQSASWCQYWEEEKWGWGEHLSDTYTMVLLTELSALLLFAKVLPDDLRGRFLSLFEQLLAWEDLFAPGPRVPAIRSYAFVESPPLHPFRAFVQPLANERRPASPSAHPSVTVRLLAETFGPWFDQAGWQQLLPTPPPALPSFGTIPCYGGASAHYWISPSFRVGAMSHYPLMEGIEHPTWGLSWQSFPAAFWCPAGDWGFWRWVTRTPHGERAHPAIDKHKAYLNNALSTSSQPPPVPEQKASLTPNGHLQLTRSLPLPAKAEWEEVTDAFCLVNSSARVSVKNRDLFLAYPEVTLRITWRGDGQPVLQYRENTLWWMVTVPPSAINGTENIIHEWWMTLL